MSKIIDQFGVHVGKNAEAHPERIRKEILAAYKLFGWYQHHFPDQRKPKSRQYLADACMKFMVDGFSHPEHAAMVSIFMPCELLHAFGISPICAEMFSTYLNGAGAEKAFAEAAEKAGIADTYCSYHKVVMGAALTGVLPSTRYIINTSLACDANNLTFRALSEKMGTPQFYVEVPYRKEEYSVEYVMQELKELAAALEEREGKSLDPGLLKMYTDRSAETIRNIQKTIPLRKTRYLPGDLTSELYEALMMHNALGSEEALEYSRLLKKDFEHVSLDEGKRILWMHTNPFWQKSAQELLNYRPDQHVAATELSYDVWQNYHTDDPFRFMAERLVYDPYNGPISDRIRTAEEMAQKVSADGVVLFCHWGCKETCGASPYIKQQLEAAGFPTLILNGDGVDRSNTSDGQISTRLGAFMEMLGGMK